MNDQKSKEMIFRKLKTSSKNNVKLYPGVEIHNWTILSNILRNDDKNASYVKAKCICGKEKYIVISSLLRGQTKSCCGQSAEKEKNGNWKGYRDIPGTKICELIKSAKKRNLEYNLSIEYLADLFEKQEKKCALSGVKLVFTSRNALTPNRCDSTASLDRIDNKKGYIKGNVRWVHKDVNMARQRLSDSDFINLCNNVSEWSKKP